MGSLGLTIKMLNDIIFLSIWLSSRGNMDYVNLGKSGVKVSKIALGCMSFGREADEKESIQMVNIAFDNGINFFDTANSYSNGGSEEILGEP